MELKTKFETTLAFDDFHRKNRDGAYCGVNDYAFLLYFCGDRPMFFFGGDAILVSIPFHNCAIRYRYADNNADCLHKEMCK